jgi:hypothetical protein
MDQQLLPEQEQNHFRSLKLQPTHLCQWPISSKIMLYTIGISVCAPSCRTPLLRPESVKITASAVIFRHLKIFYFLVDWNITHFCCCCSWNLILFAICIYTRTRTRERKKNRGTHNIMNSIYRMSVCVYSVAAVSCVGSGLASGWSPFQGVLPTVYRIKKLKKPPHILYIYIYIYSRRKTFYFVRANF